MPRARTFRLAALVLANVLLPVAVLIFASGFFPFKPFLPGLAVWEDVAEPGEKIAGDGRAGGEGGGGYTALAKQPEPAFDRVVFMVVDALRSDFVFGHGSGFEFVQSLIRDGAAIPFTAHATPPTVTMPRVKALTTGSVPSFLDLILNFAESDTSSSLATQDTWLAQLRAARNGRLVFYGDDTWLKLFPPGPSSTEAGTAGIGAGQGGGEPFWLRHDGTSSFFVSDFTEVDHNVTRHLPAELARADWHAMVLHYLGFDHIGHKTGPQGPNMLPKQREMDGIVRMIFEAVEREPQHARTLLVLAGDHGMNAGGNHGGSGPGETEPALVFASPRFRTIKEKEREQYECPTLPREGTEFHFYSKVGQSDVVPTLAGLLGMPVSKNSLGVLIREVSGLWTGPERVRLLRQNARQLVTIVKAKYGAEWFEGRVDEFLARMKEGGVQEQPDDDGGAETLAFLWAGLLRHSRSLESLPEEDLPRHEAEAYRFLLAAQKAMSDTASSYDIPRMVLGMGLASVALGAAVLSLPSLWPPTSAGGSFALTALLYGGLMFASSYVEEEQRFWYWVTPAWIVVLACTRLRLEAAREGGWGERQRTALATFALLTAHRLSVRWNQTGQKHAGAPDIAHAFFPAHHALLWLLVLATYALQGVLLHRRTLAGLLAPEVAAVVASAVVLVAVVFKLNFTQADAPELVLGLAEGVRGWTAGWSLVVQARAVFASLAVVALGTVVGTLTRAAKSGERQGDGARVSLTDRLHHLLTLFLLTQTRAPNVPLFALLEIQRAALGLLLTSPSYSSTTTTTTGRSSRVLQTATSALLLSHTSFFCAGGSNSISSIDLSHAYNGVADYNIAAVGLLLFAGNWAGPVWCCSAAVLLMRGRETSELGEESPVARNERDWVLREREELRRDVTAVTKAGSGTAGRFDSVEEGNEGANEDWRAYLAAVTAFVAASLVAVMAACTVLRTHLFIWTVFSPKFLYAMAWSAGWHLGLNVGLGSLLWKMSRTV